MNKALKKKAGALLLKLSRAEFYGLTAEENQMARVLEGRGLTRYVGPDRYQPPGRNIAITDLHEVIQMAANAYFALTGAGEEMVLKVGEQNLLAGKFLLPSDPAWYDRFPYKLLLPAIVSVFVSIVTTYLATRVINPPQPTATQTAKP